MEADDPSADAHDETPYDPAEAALAASAPSPMGRGRGRGRGRGGGGVVIAGIAELDASLGRPPGPAGSSGGGGGGGSGGGTGRGKPGGRGGGEKDFRGPEGLFKKGDWTCNACGNVNWERRSTCNKCNNAKPNVFALDEV